MSFDFSNNGYVSKNGGKSLPNSEHVIYSTTERGSFFNPKASPKRMEIKLFLTVLSWIGFSSYIAGIFLNLNNWKADILFLCGLAFMLLKFIRLTIRTWQSYKREEIEQQILKKKVENE